MGRILNLWGRHMANKVNRQLKQELWVDERVINQRYSEYKQKQTKNSIQVLLENEEVFDEKDLQYIKDIVDITLDGKPKERDKDAKPLSKKQLLRNIQNRLSNKMLIYEDHQFIRSQIQNFASKKIYDNNYTITDYKKEMSREYELKHGITHEQVY